MRLPVAELCALLATDITDCAGFLKQFMGVCNPDKTHGTLAAVVMELSGGQVPSRVLCCGHSLGGALATLGKSAGSRVQGLAARVMAGIWSALGNTQRWWQIASGIIPCGGV